MHIEIAAGDLLLRAAINLRIGDTMLLAKLRPIQMRGEEHDQRDAGKDDAEGDLHAEAVLLKPLVLRQRSLP